MIEDIYSSQIQLTIYQLFAEMIQRYLDNMDAAENGASSANSSQTQTAASQGLKYNGSFKDLFQAASKKYGVDEKLIESIVKAESNFNPSAVSSAGAQGLMQLMPATAQGLGVNNPLDPAQNVDGGVRFLRQLLDHYNGNVSLAVAAYNAGPGAVDRYGGVPPYTETQTYVKRVLASYGSTNWSSQT